MTTFWRVFNAGGNLGLLVLAFCLIETPGLFFGQYTISRTIQQWWANGAWWLALILQGLALLLFVHFFAGTK